MNDPQPFFLDSAQISLRLAEAKKSRQMIKWLGYDILLSDLPVDCNDAEYPLCESFCCNCNERMWVFATMQTSCQICGHDFSRSQRMESKHLPRQELSKLRGSRLLSQRSHRADRSGSGSARPRQTGNLRHLRRRIGKSCGRSCQNFSFVGVASGKRIVLLMARPTQTARALIMRNQRSRKSVMNSHLPTY